MQPKFTLRKLGLAGTTKLMLIMFFVFSSLISFSQKRTTVDMQVPQTKADVLKAALPLVKPTPSKATTPQTTNSTGSIYSKKSTTGVVTNTGGVITDAPTTVSSGGAATLPNNNGNATITFNFRNNNSYGVNLQSISSICQVDGPTTVNVYYKTSAINGLPGAINAGNGWNLLGTATIAGIGNAVDNSTLQPFLTGQSLLIPAGATYGILVEALDEGTTVGNLVYSTPSGTPPVFSNGGCDIISGVANVGYGGVAVPGAPTFTPRGFIGSVTFDQATCNPVNATAPVISGVPSSTCAGTPITLSILSGNLNGAANWFWYDNPAATGVALGSGTTFTVSPVVNTTYYVRGEGGCAPAPGPIASRAVTVTACSCLVPDVATICAGAIQRISLSSAALETTTTTFASGAINLAIPDNSPAGITTAPIVLPATAIATASNLRVRINATHTWVGDLTFRLNSPCGTTFLFDRPGVPASGVGVGNSNNLSGVYTFDLSAATVLSETGLVPSGTYRPSDAAGAAHNWAGATFPCAGAGNWTLTISDNAGGDFGTLADWSILVDNTNTAIFSPATDLFTDAGATIPYVAGTPVTSVWAKPATTTTYTATISGGPCVGANTVTVNVLPVSTLSVTPNGLPSGVCASATLVASGGSVYNWTPSTGLNTTTGSTVIATPSVNTTYTVSGFSANGCPVVPASVQVLGTSTSAVISSLGAPPTPIWNENWDVVAPLPAGWAAQNLSAPVGTTGWFQGNAAVFPAFNGGPTSYIGANFNNTAGTGTISNWLFAPTTTLQNGDVLEFYARSNNGFADRLQVRMSTSGASVNAGANATSTGDFGTLLLDINPTYNLTAFPNVWTRYTASVSGLGSPTSGRLAFRYFVENGGPSGANSDFMGIDNVTLLRPPAVTCANTLSNIKVDITGGTGPYTLVYTNGTTNFIVNGYVSGTPIDVFPSATTTYTIVSVTGANGCVGVGNTGAAVITVTPPPSITTQPANRTTCAGLNTSFTVTAGPSLGTTYQWQVSTNGGTSYTNIANAAPYSGATTGTLTITGATAGLNQNLYRVIVSGACPAPGSSVTSSAATLFVNITPTIVTQPVNTTRCLGTTATFTVVANAPNGPVASTYQWQVSTNNGLTYTNITGATAATLTLTNVTLLMNNNLYRVVVTTAPCATTVTSNGARLNVNALPEITIATPVTSLTPGVTTVITATTSPAPLNATSYSWTLNGATVASANTSTITADVDKLGAYRATVTDINGCVNSSNVIVIDAQFSDRLWIYPNPSDGRFQVRLFYGSPTAEADNRVVSVYNSQGQLVARKNIDLRRTTPPYVQVEFDLSNQPAGTYVVKVTEKSTEKIVSGFLLIL